MWSIVPDSAEQGVAPRILNGIVIRVGCNGLIDVLSKYSTGDGDRRELGGTRGHSLHKQSAIIFYVVA